jgi:predicted Rossmann fold nucleotide-binding protein DprA/Smf involved in DNA uptake
VVSAGGGSGALYTARAALELRRGLAATPGSPGTQMLLAGGASAVETGADLDDVLAGRRRRPVRPEPTAAGARVLAALTRAGGPLTLDQLAGDREVALSVGGVAALLCELEADGWIIPIPGGAYVGAL